MPAKRKKRVEAASRGLAAGDLASGEPSARLADLTRDIEADGGAVLAAFRDPLGGHWQALASLPIEKVAPTPFQRDLSPAHAKRLAAVIEKLDRFLDPIIAVRNEEGLYWTPNGHHRLAALRQLGARAIVALVLPEPEISFKILALNTEKAHNLREKSLEVIRMARELAQREPRPETEYALEFEEASYLTLGLCYEKRGRFSGGAYHSVLKRVDEFLPDSLPKALRGREGRAARLLELDDAVNKAIEALKAKGLQSPYLRAFVVARVNPLRFQRGAKASFDATLEKMLTGTKKFKPDSIKPEHLARAGGAPEE